MSAVTIPIRVRWSDLDAYGHVNNAAMLTLLEEVRIAVFWRGEGLQQAGHSVEDTGTRGSHGSAGGVGSFGSHGSAGGVESLGADDSLGFGSSSATFIARQEIEYLKPVLYPAAPLPVRTWVSRLGGASVDVDYTVPADDGSTAVKARTIVVLMDTTTMKPRRLTVAERSQLAQLLDVPLTFRRG